jgi:glucose/arabinose dehydrogenase
MGDSGVGRNRRNRERDEHDPQSIGLRKVAEAEIAPTDLAVAPGQPDRKYVVDQVGRVLVLDEGGFREEPFLDVRDRVVDLNYGHDERGLLGLAFHPDFEENRRFFVRYSTPPRADTPEDFDHTEVLSEFVAPGGETADADSERVLLEIPHPQFTHNGGDLAFGPDGYLYLSMGDGGGQGDTGPGHVEGGNGQDVTENLLGSVLRIDVDGNGEGSYAIPDDNPLVGEEGLDEIYAWGFRNPWRLSFDSGGRLFVADVGQHLFEEVNLMENGHNYGWNEKEGSHGFDPDATWEPAGEGPDENDRGEELVDPVVEYPHFHDSGEHVGAAVIGGHVYEGDAIPELEGAYVFGDLSRAYDKPRGRLFAATPPEPGGGVGGGADDGVSDEASDGWNLEPLAIEGVESNLLDGYLFALGRDRDDELYVLTSRYLNTREERRGAVYEVVAPEESEVSGPRYGWFDAASDAYWYSLYNMNNTFVMSGNGITFPFDEDQFDSLSQEFAAVMKGLMQRGKFVVRRRQILEAAGKDELPVKNPHLNVAPFTTGDPHFLEAPDVPTRNKDQRPDADTLRWDREKSSRVVTPASVGWTHLKGVTWAKSFEHEFDLAPIASKDRPQILGTAAQLGIKFALQNGHLRANPDDEEDMRLIGTYRPATDEVVEETARPDDYAAMLWFLSDMVSFAENDWFGYENPSPMIDADEIQRLADGMAIATIRENSPDEVLDAATVRDLGVLLGATGWYGTHAGDADLAGKGIEYANVLADAVESNLAADGKIENGGPHRAATQGVVGQGLLWASQIDGVDRRDAAESVLGHLLDDCWDESAGTFRSGDGDTYVYTPRDAGDVTAGLNAADAVLGMDGVKERFATYFDNTFNRGRLQRATRWQAYEPTAEYPLPLPQDAGEQSSPSPASQAQQDAGGEYGQADVYNAEIAYDTAADEWRVTDDSFDTEGALYLANQDLWISIWGGSEFPGRGVPGESDRLERW